MQDANVRIIKLNADTDYSDSVLFFIFIELNRDSKQKTSNVLKMTT